MYRTPQACYTKAPVRRENAIEWAYRVTHHQVPPFDVLRVLGKDDTRPRHTVNKGLRKGKASYIKDVTQGSRFGALK